MKKVLYILCFLFPVSVFGQFASSVDLGAGLGVSSYYGDINQEVPFYNPQMSFGGFLRMNINERYAVRANITSTRFVGDDADFKNPYQQHRKASFDTNIVELAAIGEFNFFPYVNPPEWGFAGSTLHGLLGIGTAMRFNGRKDKISVPVIIMGVGYKRILNERIALEVEWGWRKCLNDSLDGIEDPTKTGKKSRWFNNDWYNVLEVKLSFNFWQRSGKCRTYDKDTDL